MILKEVISFFAIKQNGWEGALGIDVCNVVSTIILSSIYILCTYCVPYCVGESVLSWVIMERFWSNGRATSEKKLLGANTGFWRRPRCEWFLSFNEHHWRWMKRSPLDQRMRVKKRTYVIDQNQTQSDENLTNSKIATHSEKGLQVPPVWFHRMSSENMDQTGEGSKLYIWKRSISLICSRL